MSEYNISNILKQLRKTAGYSASDVVYKLKNYKINISAKTLYGYESGLSMPNADVFVALCRIYNCDNPMDIVGNCSIEPADLKLIENYHSLDDHGKELVNLVLSKEVSRCRDYVVNTDAGPVLLESQTPTEDTDKRIRHYNETLMAAHNDHADEPGELEKMQEDLANLSQP